MSPDPRPADAGSGTQHRGGDVKAAGGEPRDTLRSVCLLLQSKLRFALPVPPLEIMTKGNLEMAVEEISFSDA